MSTNCIKCPKWPAFCMDCREIVLLDEMLHKRLFYGVISVLVVAVTLYSSTLHELQPLFLVASQQIQVMFCQMPRYILHAHCKVFVFFV